MAKVYKIWGIEDHVGVGSKEVVILRMIEETDISGPIIVLAAVDDEGVTKEGWRILRVLSNGRWIRYKKVDPKLGFQLDTEGRIIVN